MPARDPSSRSSLSAHHFKDDQWGVGGTLSFPDHFEHLIFFQSWHDQPWLWHFAWKRRMVTISTMQNKKKVKIFLYKWWPRDEPSSIEYDAFNQMTLAVSRTEEQAWDTWRLQFIMKKTQIMLRWQTGFWLKHRFKLHFLSNSSMWEFSAILTRKEKTKWRRIAAMWQPAVSEAAPFTLKSGCSEHTKIHKNTHKHTCAH